MGRGAAPIGHQSLSRPSTLDTVPVRIFDTLERCKVPLVTREPGSLSMYVCGPTVYDVPHVGHGRMTLVFDIIRRYLEWSGLSVRFVSNVTDIDDKIIARAAAAGEGELAVAARFESVWWDEMDRLGVRRPDATPHATEYVGHMLALIGELVDRGHAYAVPGRGVYFDVTTYHQYGALPHRPLAALIESAGARVDVDEAKRNAVDFALWKSAKPDEPRWDSPWGPGRPGWHIECSAMSLDLLGEGFDLHGGGHDLVFPHHENERAQAEAAGHPFARHWLHSGMVEVGGQKMSKSLGNFRTLADAVTVHGPRAVRLAVAQSHYRKAMDLGDVELTSAAAGVARLDALARRAAAQGIDVGSATSSVEVTEAFRTEMDDDFGTPGAVAAIFEAVSAANQAIDDLESARAATLVRSVVELAGVLGLTVETAVDIDQEIDALVARRDAARLTRDFAAADRIRDELSARGVVLEDTAGGTVWHRG